MLSVAEALERILAHVEPLPAETVPLAEAHARVLAEDIAAKLTQPPFPSSAMDGYAVRRQDVANPPARLKLAGTSAAGHPYRGRLAPGEAVRIFTGGAIPEGADCVVIQENVTASDGYAEIREVGSEDFVRPRGFDFSEGDILLRAGRRLTARDLLLAAQMNYPALPVRRRPSVAVLASGDELVPPGGTLEDGQIISSIPAGLCAMLANAGAQPLPLGIARDTLESLSDRIGAASEADLLVTIGGASVGDHDLVREALETAGYKIAFHKIAMRPGKPLMSGARGQKRIIGLPGNPVSAMVCSIIFLMPLISALLGETPPPTEERLLPLAAPLPANGPRQHYMRAKRVLRGNQPAVEALPSQDSSLTATLAEADCLIIRPPHAPGLMEGDIVSILPLGL